MRNKNCCARNKLGRWAASVLAMVTALTACTSDGYRYSTDYPCNFTFYVSYHQTSVLARVLDNPGLYVWVEVQKKLGVNHLMVHPNNGDADEDIALTTEIENNRLDYDMMGANGQLIVGCSPFGEWKAYDRQCPYCLDNTTTRNHPLAWTNNGQAVKCSRCSRVYNLSSGISDDGERLKEYRVQTNGTVIQIHN
ncbi:MAG: hypothetical protein PUC79_07440 [Prevotellaceae bacterium]|nr:hypothetical protein [Prevotellaceae bacterium]